MSDSDAIKRIVSAEFKVNPSDLEGGSRREPVATARRVAMRLAYELPVATSLAGVGEQFGGRDHGTVIHAIKSTKAQAETNRHFRAVLERIKAACEQALGFPDAIEYLI